MTHPADRQPRPTTSLRTGRASSNVSPLNGVTSLFSPAEADRSLDQLEDSGGDLVIERLSDLPPRGFLFGVPEFATILRERGYRLVAEYPGLHLRVWRRAASDAAAARPAFRM